MNIENIDPISSQGFMPQSSQSGSKKSEQHPEARAVLIEKLQDTFSKVISPYVDKMEQAVHELQTKLPSLSGDANEQHATLIATQNKIDALLNTLRVTLTITHATDLENLVGNQQQEAVEALMEHLHKDFSAQEVINTWRTAPRSDLHATDPLQDDSTDPLPRLADLLKALADKSDKDKCGYLQKLLMHRISHQLETLYGEDASIFNMQTHSKELKALWDHFFSTSVTQSWQSASAAYQGIVNFLQKAGQSVPNTDKTPSTTKGATVTQRPTSPQTTSLPSDNRTAIPMTAASTVTSMGAPATATTRSRLGNTQNLPSWAQAITHDLDNFHYSKTSPQGTWIEEIENWLTQHANEPNAQASLARYLNATYNSSSMQKDLYFTHVGLSHSDAAALYKVLNNHGVTLDPPEPTPTDQLLFSLMKQPCSTEADRAVQQGMVRALEAYHTNRGDLQIVLNNLYKAHPDAGSIGAIAQSLELTNPAWISQLMTSVNTHGGDFGKVSGIANFIAQHQNDPDLAADVASYLNSRFQVPPNSAGRDVYFLYPDSSCQDIQDFFSALKSNGIVVTMPEPTDIDSILFKLSDLYRKFLPYSQSNQDAKVCKAMMDILSGLNFQESYGSQIDVIKRTFTSECNSNPWVSQKGKEAIAKALGITV